MNFLTCISERTEAACAGNGQTQAKLQRAQELYEEGDYFKAIQVLDQLVKAAQQINIQFRLPDNLLKIYFPLPQTYLKSVVANLPREIKSLSLKDQVTFVLIFFALMRQESVFNPDAVSSVGAKGLTQIMPTTAQNIAEDLGLSSYDLSKPEDSLRMGAYYFAQFIDEYGIDHITVALAAYNTGPGNAKKILRKSGSVPFGVKINGIPETRIYVKNIKYYLKYYRQLYQDQIRGALSPTIVASRSSVTPAEKEKEKKLYRVVVAYAKTKEEAQQYAVRLKALEVACYVSPEPENQRFRVQAGAFKNKLFAKELLSALKPNFPEVFILEAPVPSSSKH